jgi:hypothetical protein
MAEVNDTTVKKRGRPRINAKRVPYTSVGKRGVPLRSQSRELVSRVRDFFQREKINKGPLLPVERVVDRTAAAFPQRRRGGCEKRQPCHPTLSDEPPRATLCCLRLSSAGLSQSYSKFNSTIMNVMIPVVVNLVFYATRFGNKFPLSSTFKLLEV